MALSRRARFLLAAVLLAGLGGGLAAWLLWPEPPPEPDAAASDTGLNRQQVEDLMRSIGYVQ